MSSNSPEYAAAYHQRTKETRREKRNARKRAYYHRHKHLESAKRKNNRLKSLYGISSADRDAMLAAQGSTCAICKNPFESKPQVDHCHASGKIRGILCRPCNLLLGLAKERVETLRRAIKYLEFNRE